MNFKEKPHHIYSPMVINIMAQDTVVKKERRAIKTKSV